MSLLPFFDDSFAVVFESLIGHGKNAVAVLGARVRLVVDLNLLLAHLSAYCIASRITFGELSTMFRHFTDPLLKISLHCLVSLVCFCQTANAESCKKDFGVLVDFANCPVVELPSITVALTKAERPDPRVAMMCWKYRVSTSKEFTTFEQCNTGELGGGAKFALAGHDYFVVFDVQGDCESGHVFFDSNPKDKQNQKILDDFANLEKRCRENR